MTRRSNIRFPWQLALLAVAVTTLPALIAWLLLFYWQAAILAAVAVLWCGAAFFGIGQRFRARLGQLEQRALQVRLAAPGASLPVFKDNTELQAATLELQRMVSALHAKQQALEAQNTALGQSVLERTMELTTLSSISQSLASQNDERAQLNEVMLQLELALEYASASVWARRDGEVRLVQYRRAGDATSSATVDTRLSKMHEQHFEQLEQTLEPMVMNTSAGGVVSWLLAQVFGDVREDRLYQTTRSWMAVPLAVRGDLVGVLRLDHQQSNFFNFERQRLLIAIGHQTALALQHARLYAQAQQVAVAAERNRLARDLHDAVSQSLFASSLTAETLAKTWGDQHAGHAQVLELQTLNRSALAEMRLLLFELRPDAFAHASLGELLRHSATASASRQPLELELQISEMAVLPENIKMQLYRIAQEAINNTVRHSRATKLEIEVNVPANSRCLIRIADDGQGFDPAQRTSNGHFGLSNMRDRALEIMADLEIESLPGGGTSVTVVWQLEPVDA